MIFTLQWIIGAIFVLIGLIFPVYIYGKYGLADYKVLYLNTGDYEYHSYFLISLAMGCLSCVVGSVCYFSARYTLKKMRRDADEQ
jgi:hypothetical protein